MWPENKLQSCFFVFEKMHTYRLKITSNENETENKIMQEINIKTRKYPCKR